MKFKLSRPWLKQGMENIKQGWHLPLVVKYRADAHGDIRRYYAVRMLFNLS